MTDIEKLNAREAEVQHLAEVLSHYKGEDLTTLYLGNFRRVLTDRDNALEEIERLREQVNSGRRYRETIEGLPEELYPVFEQ